jgi:hypothetical protein
MYSEWNVINIYQTGYDKLNVNIQTPVSSESTPQLRTEVVV